MKKYYIIFCGILATFSAYGQFTPPDDATQAVTVDATTLDIVNPDRAAYINQNFMLLTPGVGITGTPFNGASSQTWSIDYGAGLIPSDNSIIVDTSWLVENYHQNLLPQNGIELTNGTFYNGQIARNIQIDASWMDANYAQNLTISTGLLLDTGTTYNGKAPRTITVDRSYIEDVIVETAFVVDNYNILIDTTPSVNPGDALQQLTSSSNITIDFQNYSYDFYRPSNYPTATLTQPYNVLTQTNGQIGINPRGTSIVVPGSASIGMKTDYSICFKFSSSPWSAIPYYTDGFISTATLNDSDTSFVGISVAKTGTNRLRVQYRAVPNGTKYNINCSVDTNVSNQIYSVCVTLNSSTSILSVYVDGQFSGSAGVVPSEITETSMDLTINGFNSNNTTYYDVQVFNGKVLTNTEIASYVNGEHIDGADIVLGNHVDASSNLWYNGYISGALNYQDGYQNAVSRSIPFSFSYNVPKITYWTDAEFKVLDESGNLIYWVSTQYGAQMGGAYTTNPATDLNAKIWYTCSENENTGAGRGRKWILYVYNATNARTIYEHAQRTTGASTPTIGGIIIQPNLSGNTVGGTSIESIFGTVQGDTPTGYSYVFLKCSPTNFERSNISPNNPIWRPYNALSNAIQRTQ